MLTDTALRNLKPKSKIYKVFDRDGMYVTVSTAGTVTLRVVRVISRIATGCPRLAARMRAKLRGDVSKPGGGAQLAVLFERQRSRWNGRRMDDRRRRATMRREVVENRFELVHAAQIELHEVAILSSDPVTLGDLWDVTGDLGNYVQIIRLRTHANDRANDVAQRTWIDINAIGQGAGFFQPFHAFRDGRC